MGQGTDHALWLRGVLIAERTRRDWSLEQTARAIARELGADASLSKQSLHAWEQFRVQPRIDQFAAWARALGMRLEVDLIDPRADTVAVRVPTRLSAMVRAIASMTDDDQQLVSDFVSRLTRK